MPNLASLQAQPTLASTFGHVAGPSQAEPVAAGARCAAELAVPVLVGPWRARHTLAGLSAEVGARLAGHCRGKGRDCLWHRWGAVAGQPVSWCLKPRLRPIRAQPLSLWLKGTQVA